MTSAPVPPGPGAPALLTEPVGSPLPAGEVVGEAERLAALARYGVLDTPPEQAFDDLCELASQLCGTPTAMVSLVDEGRQWFKARLGMDLCWTDRDDAFCAHALTDRAVMVVPDATQDPRFADNPLVVGEGGIRFYAGAPLVSSDGFALGTLCVIDTVPRVLSARQVRLLQALARQAMTQLEHRRQAHTLAVEVAAREVAEAAHAETQRVLAGVLENTDVIMYAKDLDGRFLLANPALHALLEPADGQIVGRTDAELVGGQEAQEFAEHDRAVARSGARQVLRERLTHRDGSVHTYLSTKFPLRDADGQVYAVAGVSTDVTELDQARAELAESRQRWRALVENSPVAVALYSASDLRFVYANARAAELYGARTPQDLLGRRFVDLFVGEHRAAYLQRLRRTLAGETVLGVEARIVGFDGHGRDVEVNASAVTHQGQRAVQVEMRDVTARVAATASLRASEERFRVMFDTAPTGAVESLPDGTILAVNPRLCRMLGYTAHELIGQPISLLTDPSDHDRLHESVSRLQTPHGPAGYSVQRTYRRKDGSTLPVVVSVAAVRDADGTAQRVVASFLDVSERVEMEQRLRATAEQLAERQAFTDALLDSVEVGIVACDADGHLTRFNGAARLWHGVEADAELDPAELARHYDLYEADGTTPLPNDRVPLLVALTSGSVVDAEIVIAPKDLPPTRVLCTGQVLRDEHGDARGAVVAMHDITVLREGEHRLREHAAFQEAVLAASPDVIYLVDPVENRNLWSSANLLETLGYTHEQIADLGGEVHTSLVHPEDVSRLRATNTACRGIADGQVLQVRYRARAADGQYRWLARRATPFARDPDGDVTELLAIARDITDVVQVEQRLSDAALHDALTGLPNRTLLADRLSSALARTARAGGQVAILYCDLDGFKHVNDTAGHAAGDAVLVAAAERLRHGLRPSDTVARVGGDEFVVVLEPVPGAPEDAPGQEDVPGRTREDPRAAATLVADRLRRALAQPLTVDGQEHTVTVSIGMSFLSAGDDPEQALRNADAAMYRAKTAGKDRHEVF